LIRRLAALDEGGGTKGRTLEKDDRDRLAFYPFVVVRIACRVCSRSGSYWLARLAAKYGPEITLRDRTDRFSYGLPLARRGAVQGRQVSVWVYLPDLVGLPAGPRETSPPDLPAGLLKLRLIKND
jgi:hypothetical protein